MPATDDWVENSKLVLYELERQNGCIVKLEDVVRTGQLETTRELSKLATHDEVTVLRDELAAVKRDIVGLKGSATRWGALAGAIPALAAVLVSIFKK